MGSGGIPNRPQIDPKWQEILQITQSGYQMAPKTPWINEWHPFWLILGPLWDHKVEQKSVFCENGCSKERLFTGFVANAVVLDFLVDFWSIFDEISMQK